MQWKKIYYAENEVDANIIKGLLESNGLEVQIVPKSAGNIIKSPYFHTNYNIAYELFVLKDKQEQAEKILNSTK